MKQFFILALLAAMLSACAGNKAKEQPKEVVPPPVAQAQPSAPKEPTPTVTAAKPAAIEVDPLKDPNNILSKRSVYFDFDQYQIKPEYRALVEAHAKYLKDHPKASIRLEGNADERGSREYNLSLGQKRAVAVEQAMNVLGVPNSQIETISLGKEKPKALGHDEASWAQNRRVDIVYPGE